MGDGQSQGRRAFGTWQVYYVLAIQVVKMWESKGEKYAQQVDRHRQTRYLFMD